MEFEIVAEGLSLPEGPVACDDGSVILCEIGAGRVTRVMSDGRVQAIAETGGNPSGLGVGSDGAVYCCNGGGSDWSTFDGWHCLPPADYTGGSIQRIDMANGHVDTILTAYAGRTFGGPNDLVFAADGSFWFTDFGKYTADCNRHGGLYQASIDGATLRQVSFGTRLNGVGLSPDGATVYAAATAERWMLAFDTDPAAGLQPGRVLASFAGRHFPDSLAIEADGVIAVGCIEDEPGVSRVDPESGATSLVRTPDRLPTNIAFGGADMRTAWITFTERGALAKCRWPTAGLRLPFNL